MKLKVTLLSLHYCSFYNFLPAPQLRSSDKRKNFKWLRKNFGTVINSQFKFQVLENGNLSSASEHSFKELQNCAVEETDVETAVLQILLN